MRAVLLCIAFISPIVLTAQTPTGANNDYNPFFRKDTAYIQGYINGYNPQSGPKNSLVYLGNTLTGEDSPVVVKIHPDGKFDSKLLLNHPVESSFLLDDLLIPFYVEPGQTLSINIDLKAILEDRCAFFSNSPIKGLEYEGPSATISQMYRSFWELENLPDALLYKAEQELTPDQFMEKMTLVSSKWDLIGDSLIQLHGTSEKAIHLIKNKIALRKAKRYFSYLLSRTLYAQKDTSNLVLKVEGKDSHYSFLKDMPLNDETIMADVESGSFINRFEYMPPLQKARNIGIVTLDHTHLQKPTSKDIDRMVFTNHQTYLAKGDSVVRQLSGQANSFLWQVSLVRRLRNDLKNYKTHKAAENYINALCNQLTYPVLIAESRRILETVHPRESIKSYQLPECKATDIFRNIIKAHTGKVLFIDFWHTSCGGCRQGIQETAELRQKYKNHPEFQFVYISGDYDSKATYDTYVAKNLQGEACYRINEEDYNYLRELFRFNGIPHYEMIEKDGSVMTNCPMSWGLKSYLEKRFGASTQK